MGRIAIAVALAILVIVFTSCDSSPSARATTRTPPRPTPAAKTTLMPKPPEEPVLNPPLPGIKWLTPPDDNLPVPSYQSTPEPTLPPTPSPTIQPKASPTVRPTPTPTPFPQRTLPPQPRVKKDQAAEVVGRPLTFIFLSWFESDLAVALYQGSNYTFRAKPGYKFIILEYRFKNDYNEELITPEPNSGEILTRPKDFVYKLWAPPSGTASEPYRPYLSAPDDLAKFGHTTGGNVKLVQEYGVRGRVIFEIPKEMTPVEASLAVVKARLVLD